MPSLAFGNLPLVEVSCTFRKAEPSDIGFDLACSLRDRFRHDLPDVADFMGGKSDQGFSMVLGAPAGIGLKNPEKGLVLHVRAQETKVTWGRQISSEYPGYSTLRSLMDTVSKIEQQKRVSPVQMAYVNHVPFEHGDIADLIVPDALPKMALSSELLHQAESSWRISAGLDYRMAVQRTEQGFVLICAAGMTKDQEPVVMLDETHEALQSQFLMITSERAKEVWKYAGAS